MKSIIVTSALTIAIATLFAIGSSPLVFATSFASGNSVAGPSNSITPLLATVPVTLSFSPKTVFLHSGASCAPGYYCGTNTLTITNTGSKSVTFTGCQFFYKPASSTTFKKGTCNLGGSVNVPGHSTLKGTWTTSAMTSTPPGTYNAKVDWINSVDKSGTGTFKYVVP